MGLFDDLTAQPQSVSNSNTDAASNTFKQAAQVATPSIQSMDTAAARVRSRLAGRERATSNQLRDQFAGAGRANSGRADLAQAQNRQSTTNAMSSAFTDLELGFEDRKNAFAQTLSQIGQGQGNLGLGQIDAGSQFSLAQNDLDLRRHLGELEIQKTEEEGIRRALLEAFSDISQYGNTQLNPTSRGFYQEILSRLFGLTPVANPGTLPIPPTTSNPSFPGGQVSSGPLFEAGGV